MTKNMCVFASVRVLTEHNLEANNKKKTYRKQDVQ